MNTISLLKPICVLACVAAMQTAAAQGVPTFSGNSLFGNQTTVPFQIIAAPANVQGPYMELIHNSSTDASRAGSIGYVAGYNSLNPAGTSHTFVSRTSTGSWISHLRILQNGQVQIGDQAPSTQQTNYKLSVDGKLVAKSLYVLAPGYWADFVFEPTHKFMPLPELEMYLQRNKHLPTMPSASEVQAKGYDVTEMNAKLLQSVEELTLQVIELNKELQKLKAQVAVAK
ncbi:hypothetical protein [Hymenobacter terrenus]|uniref:hypothetical protein n=1 Tax=Hymenobacter terrenus TaxID=1629124 RepID=UPI000696EFA4|nr:hypothetical protein [Hymenobacter terrenus]